MSSAPRHISTKLTAALMITFLRNIAVSDLLPHIRTARIIQQSSEVLRSVAAALARRRGPPVPPAPRLYPLRNHPELLCAYGAKLDELIDHGRIARTARLV